MSGHWQHRPLPGLPELHLNMKSFLLLNDKTKGDEKEQSRQTKWGRHGFVFFCLAVVLTSKGSAWLASTNRRWTEKETKRQGRRRGRCADSRLSLPANFRRGVDDDGKRLASRLPGLSSWPLFTALCVCVSCSQAPVSGRAARSGSRTRHGGRALAVESVVAIHLAIQ